MHGRTWQLDENNSHWCRATQCMTMVGLGLFQMHTYNEWMTLKNDPYIEPAANSVMTNNVQCFARLLSTRCVWAASTWSSSSRRWSPSSSGSAWWRRSRRASTAAWSSTGRWDGDGDSDDDDSDDSNDDDDSDDNDNDAAGQVPASTAAVDWLQARAGCCGVTQHEDWTHTQVTPTLTHCSQHWLTAADPRVLCFLSKSDFQWGRGHGGRLPHSCCDVTTSGVNISQYDWVALGAFYDPVHGA